MASSDQSDKYFADALKGRVDITNSYHVLGDIPRLMGLSSQNEVDFVAHIRHLIDNETNGTNAIDALATALAPDAAALYHRNLIAAVDGTDAVSSLKFASDTIYAAGVIRVTPQTHLCPKVHVTRTRASHLTPSENLGVTLNQAIKQWAEYLRGAREQEQSWISTFREYEEREIAHSWLQENDNHVVLIDGPLLTQNMLSQDRAHDLLQKLVTERRAIGFIKDLSANPLVNAIGYALYPGEVFILTEWSAILSDRFDIRQQQISKWIENYADEVVRAVYKINRKAFAIECLTDQVPLALAILRYDNTGSLDHDIPMLLQIADKHVRTMFNGARARAEVVARFSATDPDRFLALTNERSLR